MLSRLLLVFLFFVQTNSLPVLTDEKSQATKTDGEMVLVRQLLNQETLIRMALDKKVNDLVKVIAEIQNSLGTNNQRLLDAKREIQTINQQLLDAKKEIAALKNENRSLKAEWQFQSNVTTFFSGMCTHCLKSLFESDWLLDIEFQYIKIKQSSFYMCIIQITSRQI